MLAFDVVAVVVALGLLFVGLGVVLWRRSKTLKVREQERLRQGRHNRDMLLFEDRTRCEVCGKQTSYHDLVVNDRWYHKQCFKELNFAVTETKKEG